VNTGQKDGHFWVKVTAYIHGDLDEERFIKTFTLLLNQAIADYIVEYHLSKTLA